MLEKSRYHRRYFYLHRDIIGSADVEYVDIGMCRKPSSLKAVAFESFLLSAA